MRQLLLMRSFFKPFNFLRFSLFFVLVSFTLFVSLLVPNGIFERITQVCFPLLSTRESSIRNAPRHFSLNQSQYLVCSQKYFHSLLRRHIYCRILRKRQHYLSHLLKNRLPKLSINFHDYPCYLVHLLHSYCPLKNNNGIYHCCIHLQIYIHIS